MAASHDLTKEVKGVQTNSTPDTKRVNTLHRDDLTAALNEFLGKTAARVILKDIFPTGIKGDTLTNDEFKKLQRELRELLGTQGDLIILLLT